MSDENWIYIIYLDLFDFKVWVFCCIFILGININVYMKIDKKYI